MTDPAIPQSAAMAAVSGHGTLGSRAWSGDSYAVFRPDRSVTMQPDAGGADAGTKALQSWQSELPVNVTYR